MEDDLKKLNVEYLSNHWPDLPQILNIVLGNQTKIKDCLKWRQPPMEDDLKISKWNNWPTTDQIILEFWT